MDLAQVLQKIFLKENPDVSINPKYPKFVRSYELNKMKKNLLLLFVTALSLSGNALYGQRITLGAKGGTGRLYRPRLRDLFRVQSSVGKVAVFSGASTLGGQRALAPAAKGH